MPQYSQPKAKSERETYARLTAVQHIKIEHFSEHQKIEGYFENRDVPDFMGSDRLLRLDTIYGTIQLGYNPQMGQGFLFANIKTSIFDTAASRYQKELKEYQQMRSLKTGTQNVAYTAKRRGASAVILYKKENVPWSQRSIAPYLHKADMQALQKTMPFLENAGELVQRRQLLAEQKAMHHELRTRMKQRAYAEMAAIRERQTRLIQEQNELNALLYRKDTQRRLFFRRLNAVLDLQKHEMFAYYRDRRRGGPAAKREADPAQNNRNEDRDE